MTHKSSPFIGQEIYASIASSLKLCTLAMIDIPRFHSDSVIAPELELLLEGLVFALESSTISSPPIQNPVSTQSSAPSTQPNSDSKSDALADAKNAFMNELTGWDLPPRI